MKDKELQKLVVEAKQGKQAAFTSLYEQTRDRAYFVACRFVSSNDVADMLQEAYTAAFSAIDTFDTSKEFEPWLHTIVRNKCINYLKKKQELLTVDSECGAEVEDTEALVPAGWLEQQEKREKIIEIIDRLPEFQRVAVVLFYYEGHSVAEIAEILSIPEGTVKSRLSNARKSIKGEVLLEEQRGNKLYGVAGVPILTRIFQREEAAARIPVEISEQVLQGTLSALSSSGAVAGGAGIVAKFMALSAGVKAVVVSAAAVVVVAGVGVPVYINYQAEQEAVATIAQVTDDVDSLDILHTDSTRYNDVQEAVNSLNNIKGHDKEITSLHDRVEQFGELKEFYTAVTTLQDNYSNRNVMATNLQDLSKQVTQLNARLALAEEFENTDEIKQTIADADSIVSKIDLADPTVTVDDMEKAGTELESLKQNLGIALDTYQLTPAVVDIERIDLAVTSFDGFVGDAVVITPAVYPTMVKDADLSYTSTDENVVVVDENGSGTLTGVGSAEIVVTDAKSGVEARFTVVSQAVPQTSKPVANTQQPSGGSQQQGTGNTQQGTGNAQQGSTQQQQPSGGAQSQAPSGGNTGGSTGSSNLPKGGYISDEEVRRATQDAYGMTKDEFGGLTGEEQSKIYGEMDWGY